MGEHEDGSEDGPDINIAPLFGPAAPLLAKLYVDKPLEPLQMGAHRAFASAPAPDAPTITPLPGMVFTRLGARHPRDAGIFGPAPLEIWVVAAVTTQRAVLHSARWTDRERSVTLFLAPDGTMPLARAPSAHSFTYVADSLGDMEKFS